MDAWREDLWAPGRTNARRTTIGRSAGCCRSSCSSCRSGPRATSRIDRVIIFEGQGRRRQGGAVKRFMAIESARGAESWRWRSRPRRDRRSDISSATFGTCPFSGGDRAVRPLLVHPRGHGRVMGFCTDDPVRPSSCARLHFSSRCWFERASSWSSCGSRCRR